MVDYCFQETQKFKVDVYDADDKKHIEDLSKQDYIGSAKFTLAEVVTAKQMLSKKLSKPGGIATSYTVAAKHTVYMYIEGIVSYICM